MTETTPTRTGVIGLGAMGLQMARHMAAKGFEVCGTDIDHEAMRRASAHGVFVDIGTVDLEPLGRHVARHLQPHGAEADHARSGDSRFRHAVPLPGMPASVSPHDPAPVLLDLLVHRIWCEVQIIRPDDCAQLDPGLTEQVLVPQGRKDTGRRRIEEIRKFDRAFGPVFEAHMQPKAGQHSMCATRQGAVGRIGGVT